MPNFYRPSFIIAGALFAGWLPAQAQTNTISFEFAGNPNTPGLNLTTNQSAGVPPVAASHYNYAPGSFGSVSTLAYSDGTVSGASLTFNSYDAQNNGLDGSDPNYFSDPNSKLMNGFIESGPAGTIPTNSSSPSATVTVSSVPFSTYSVYVYFYNADGNTAGNTASQDGTFTLTTGGSATGLTQNVTTLATFDPSNPFTQATGSQAGDYLVFTGLTGTSFTLTANRQTNDLSSATQIPIDGFQVVATPAPEPAAFVPVGLGAGLVGLLALKRRRVVEGRA